MPVDYLKGQWNGLELGPLQLLPGMNTFISMDYNASVWQDILKRDLQEAKDSWGGDGEVVLLHGKVQSTSADVPSPCFDDDAKAKEFAHQLITDCATVLEMNGGTCDPDGPAIVLARNWGFSDADIAGVVQSCPIQGCLYSVL